MDAFHSPARDAGTDAAEPAVATRTAALRLGSQTLDAARGVNRHHELRMAQHYARLAQAVETPPQATADEPTAAAGMSA